MTKLGSYPGSKAGAGVLHTIIGQMPEHEHYVEAFLGHGAILRAKRPARSSIGIDVDGKIIAKWRELGRDASPPPPHSLTLICADALSWLLDQVANLGPTTLLYCDPPYLRDVRTRLFYPCEFAEAGQHAALLKVLRSLRCMVMLSGYPSKLYSEQLRGWRCLRYRAMTRGGLRTECLWMNFAPARRFADPRFCGGGFRERERVKRKRGRWQKRFEQMKLYERQLVRAALDLVDSSAAAMPAADLLLPKPLRTQK